MTAGQWYTEIDHTADVGLKIRGATLSDLFVHAAEGMTDLICQDDLPWDDREREPDRQEITLESESIEELLHEWLGELLYLHTTRNSIYTKYTIPSIDKTHLKAEIGGFHYTEDDIHHLMEIKAVTYHQLNVEQSDSGYTAQVIFDI